MPDYTYHFDDNALLSFNDSLENRLGDNSGDHEQEHFDNLQMLLNLHRRGCVLDVGAGMGRITSMARDIVAQVVALEPDESRWEACHRAYHREPDCLVLCQSTGEYLAQNPDKRFDLIVVSMVLQHVSTNLSRQIMSEVASLLAPEGAAIVYTTHALEQCKGFSFTGDNSRAFVPEEEFNAYAETPPAEQSLGLPVRRFSKQDLIDTVEGAGLRSIFWRQTSYYRPDKVGFFANRLKVTREELSHVGNSQFVVVQKAP